MGTTTLATRRRRLAALFGIPDNSEIPTQIQTEIDDFIQRALRDVYGFHRWEFLSFYSRVELEAAYTTGSVAVTAAGTAWTGTGTSWATAYDSAGTAKIRADGEIYRVASVDSTTGITATDAALKTLSGESYALYMDEVSLDSTLESITSIYGALGETRLLPMPPADMDDHKSRKYYSGRPQFFAPRGVDSNGYTIIEFYPIPAFNEVLHIRGTKAGTIPSADADTDDVPTRFSNVVDERAKAYLYEYRNDPRFSAAMQNYVEMRQRMIQAENPVQGPRRVLLDPAVYGPEPVTSEVTRVAID
jgi:hypothetical protein